MSTHTNPLSGGAKPPQPPAPTLQAGPDGEPITGVAAFGTLVQVLSDPGPPEVYVSIFGVGDITGPNVTLAEAETTSHSTGIAVRTFIPTLADPGDISFPCFWNPDDLTQSPTSTYSIEYLFWNRVVTKFQLVSPDVGHRTRQFKGYVKSISETFPLAGICTRATAIRIVSPMTDVTPAVEAIPPTFNTANAGGPGTFEVNVGGSPASWLAHSDVPWITITAPLVATVGDAAVTYTIAAGTGTARTGHVKVDALNLVHTVEQSATTLEGQKTPVHKA